MFSMERNLLLQLQLEVILRLRVNRYKKPVSSQLAEEKIKRVQMHDML